MAIGWRNRALLAGDDGVAPRRAAGEGRLTVDGSAAPRDAARRALDDRVAADAVPRAPWGCGETCLRPRLRAADAAITSIVAASAKVYEQRREQARRDGHLRTTDRP